jgi:hypothetical protein
MWATGFHVFFHWFIFIYFEAQPFCCVYEIKEDVKLTETLLSILTSHWSIFFKFTVVYEEKKIRQARFQFSKGTTYWLCFQWS